MPDFFIVTITTDTTTATAVPPATTTATAVPPATTTATTSGTAVPPATTTLAPTTITLEAAAWTNPLNILLKTARIV